MIRANTFDQLDLVVNVRDDQAGVVVIHGLAKQKFCARVSPLLFSSSDVGSIQQRTAGFAAFTRKRRHRPSSTRS
jgi:hypothetical protein